jgi:hypothetical protein
MAYASGTPVPSTHSTSSVRERHKDTPLVTPHKHKSRVIKPTRAKLPAKLLEVELIQGQEATFSVS